MSGINHTSLFLTRHKKRQQVKTEISALFIFLRRMRTAGSVVEKVRINQSIPTLFASPPQIAYWLSVTVCACGLDVCWHLSHLSQLCWGTIDGQLVDISAVDVAKLLCELLLANPTLPPKAVFLVRCGMHVNSCRREGNREECIFICKSVSFPCLWLLLTLQNDLDKQFSSVGWGEHASLCVSWRAGGRCFTCFALSFPSPPLSYQDPLKTQRFHCGSPLIEIDLNRDVKTPVLFDINFVTRHYWVLTIQGQCWMLKLRIY